MARTELNSRTELGARTELNLRHKISQAISRLLNLLRASNTSTTGRTVWGYDSDVSLVGDELGVNSTKVGDDGGVGTNVATEVGDVFTIISNGTLVGHRFFGLTVGKTYSYTFSNLNITLGAFKVENATTIGNVASAPSGTFVAASTDFAVYRVAAASGTFEITLTEVGQQTLLTVPALYPAITGGRLATTVADGASLGSELETQPLDISVAGWVASTATKDSSTGYTLTGTTGRVFKLGFLTEGKSYRALFSGDTTAGTLELQDATNGTVYASNGVEAEFVATGANLALQCQLGGSGAVITNLSLSIKEVIPVWYDTDADGASLVNSLSVANAGTNVLLHSQDLSNAAWTKTGTISVVKNLTGADGVANSGWTISAIDTIANGDTLYQNASGLTTGSTRYEPSFVMKQISTSGVLRVQAVFGPTYGLWLVDLSKLNTYWETIDRNHPAVTITTDWSTLAGTQLGPYISKNSGTGTLSVGYFNSQLELGEVSGPQKYTGASTKTDDSDVITVPTPSVLTAASGAVRMIVDAASVTNTNKYLFGCYSDVVNYLGALMTAPNIIIFKQTPTGVDTDTFAFTPTLGISFCVDFYWSATELAIRAYDVGDTPPAFSPTVGAKPFTLDSELQIGGINSTNIFQGEYANNGVPKVWSSKEAAKW